MSEPPTISDPRLRKTVEVEVTALRELLAACNELKDQPMARFETELQRAAFVRFLRALATFNGEVPPP